MIAFSSLLILPPLAIYSGFCTTAELADSSLILAYGEIGALLAFFALHHAYHGMGALSNEVSKRYGLDWNVSGMERGAGWRFGRALRIYARMVRWHIFSASCVCVLELQLTD